MFFYTEHCVIHPSPSNFLRNNLSVIVNVWLREAHTLEAFATLANLTMAHLLPLSLPKIHFKLKKPESGEEWIPL